MIRNDFIRSRVFDAFSGIIEMPLVEITSGSHDIFACDYCLKLPKIDIWIPKHTRTNYASLGIAKMFFNVKNNTQLACAVHDFLYSMEGADSIYRLKHRYSIQWCDDRLVADLIFRYVLRCSGVSPIKTFLYYQAVRLFGKSNFRKVEGSYGKL
jgi:Protein of unknown function (DUF1353)